MSASDVIAGSRFWWVETSDALTFLRTLPAGCVHSCATSPPYFGQRDYKVAGQIGLEGTVEDYIGRLLEVFAEVQRVLHPTGTLWLNLGDSYASGGGQASNGNKGNVATKAMDRRGMLPLGNLFGIPWAVAFALRDAGWVLRSDIVWSKTCAMPEGVSSWSWKRHRIFTGKSKRLKAANDNPHGHVDGSDFDSRAPAVDCPGCERCALHGGLILTKGAWRPTRSHEQIFLLAKSGGYFADGEGVRTPLADATVSRDQYSRIVDDAEDEQYAVAHDHETVGNPQGANLRDVWRLGPQPQTQPGEKHIAVFPPELVRRCVLAGSSDCGACRECGYPFARILSRRNAAKRISERGRAKREDGYSGTANYTELEPAMSATLGWKPSCTCNAGPPIPAVILDPFSGSGTTARVALGLGRRFVGCELNPKYAEQSRQQIGDEYSLLKAMKPGGN